MPEEEAPKCPVCGGATRLRTGKRGKFWGCTKYPECSGSVTAKKRVVKAATNEEREQAHTYLAAAFKYIDACGGDSDAAFQWLSIAADIGERKEVES